MNDEANPYRPPAESAGQPSPLHFMRDFRAFRAAAIRYWELRRIVYNIGLVVPTLLGYLITDELSWVGDEHERYYAYLLPHLAFSAFLANFCYTFAYVLEFLFGSDDPTSRWLRFGRTMIFFGGLLLAMFLALIGGRDLAIGEYQAYMQSLQRAAYER